MNVLSPVFENLKRQEIFDSVGAIGFWPIPQEFILCSRENVLLISSNTISILHFSYMVVERKFLTQSVRLKIGLIWHNIGSVVGFDNRRGIS